MNVRRRQFLASVAASGGVGLGGCQEFPPSDGPSETPTDAADTPTTTGRTPTSPTATDDPSETPVAEPTFDRVVNMVEDEGVDPNGETPIDDAFQGAAGDGTLLEFPPGEYLVTDPLVFQEVRNFGIRGTGSDRGDVRFVHPTGYPQLLVNIRDGANCLLENFTADQTDDQDTNTGITILQRDGLVVRDVEVAGFTPTEGNRPGQRGSVNLLPVVLDQGGVARVTRFVSTGGGEIGVYPDSYPGLYTGWHHKGTLRLVDCRVENCGGAGVYASRTFGPVQVVGGRFRNNAVAQVRVSGEGSYIRDARVTVDTEQRSADRGDYGAVRGVWWESGDRGKTGGFIENCVFHAGSAPLRRGLLEVDGTAGAMTVRNCEFRVEQDSYHAINAFPPGDSSMGGKPDGPWGITLENVRVTGPAGGRTAIKIDGRPGSSLHGLRVEQPGQDRDGIAVLRSPGSNIRASSVEANRFPIRLSLEQTSRDADCWMGLSGDVQVSSEAESGDANGDLLNLGSGPGSFCLPSFDVDDGTLVVLGNCDQGHVGRVLNGNVEGGETVSGADCL